MSWLETDKADADLLQNLRERYPAQVKLAQVLAPALRIERLLLRHARLRFVPDSGADLEAEFWFGPLVESQSANALVLQPGLARLLTDELLASPEEFTETILPFLQRHTRHWHPLDRIEQQMRLDTARGDEAGVQRGLQKALQLLQREHNAERRTDIARWARGALPGLTDDTSSLDEFGWLALFAAAQLDDAGGLLSARNSSSVTLPDWLNPEQLRKTSTDSTVALRWWPGVLECLPSGEGDHDLPLTTALPTPVRIQVEDVGEGYDRWAALSPGVRVALPLQAQSLILQTLQGERYRLQAESTPPPSAAKTDSETQPPQRRIQLLHAWGDTETAERIAALLRSYDLEVDILAYDQVLEIDSRKVAAPPTPMSVLGIWNANTQRLFAGQKIPADIQALVSGVMVRTDDTPVPARTKGLRTFDLRDWDGDPQSPLANQLLQAVNQSQAPDETVEPASDQELIQELLSKLEDPRTTPEERLEIGDRLAELGDTRPGVGVREYEILEYSPEVEALLNELDDLETKPERRLEIGDELVRFNDSRPGVGLDEQGLPDIDWVEIPAGEFIYGDEKHRLSLETFYIARYPITNAQYQAFIDAGGYEDERWWSGLKKPAPAKPGWNQSNRPRETVDWYEAVAFCRWLSNQLGYEIRLPTEQEWEKAARGTDGREYPWGDGYRAGYANVDEKSTKSGSSDLGQSTAVGLYPQGASPDGVMDMAGNVWEWCLNKYEAPEDTVVDASRAYRVLRGGSWILDPEDARAAVRYRDGPGSRGPDRGFRVVCVSPIPR